MEWQDAADRLPITQLTAPDDVHRFIQDHVGLREACKDNLRYLITYAPQLVIPGFGGEFESGIDSLYRESAGNSSNGLAAEEYALRDPAIGRYDAAQVACGFVQGNSVIGGPPCRYYDHVDYAIWLLSDASTWLPASIRAALQRGMAEWGVWPWTGNEWMSLELGFDPGSNSGEFQLCLYDAAADGEFVLNEAAEADLHQRVTFSAQLLDLPEAPATLVSRLLAPSFLGRYLSAREARR